MVISYLNSSFITFISIFEQKSYDLVQKQIKPNLNNEKTSFDSLAKSIIILLQYLDIALFIYQHINDKNSQPIHENEETNSKMNKSANKKRLLKLIQQLMNLFYQILKQVYNKTFYLQKYQIFNYFYQIICDYPLKNYKILKVIGQIITLLIENILINNIFKMKMIENTTTELIDLGFDELDVEKHQNNQSSYQLTMISIKLLYKFIIRNKSNIQYIKHGLNELCQFMLPNLYQQQINHLNKVKYDLFIHWLKQSSLLIPIYICLSLYNHQVIVYILNQFYKQDDLIDQSNKLWYIYELSLIKDIFNDDVMDNNDQNQPQQNSNTLSTSSTMLIIQDIKALIQALLSIKVSSIDSYVLLFKCQFNCFLYHLFDHDEINEISIAQILAEYINHHQYILRYLFKSYTSLFLTNFIDIKLPVNNICQMIQLALQEYGQDNYSMFITSLHTLCQCTNTSYQKKVILELCYLYATWSKIVPLKRKK